MEVVSDKRNTIQDCSGFSRAESPLILIYTPSGFQDPYQLLHLKENWFQHQYSSYFLHTKLLGHQSEIDHLKTHCAVTGFVKSHNSYSVADYSQQKWHIQLLSSVLGFPINTLPSCLPQQCHIEEVNFMDNLDLIERIKFPLAQRRSELEAVLKEDIHSIEQRTQIFKLEFDSFIQKLEPVASQFEAVLSSLFSLSPSGGVSFCEATQALRQCILWVDSDLFAAFVNICRVTAVPLNHRDKNIDTTMVCLQRDGEQPPSVLLCARVVSPMSILHWYEHAVAQNLVNFGGSLKCFNSEISCHSVHHWTPNCYRQCN